MEETTRCFIALKIPEKIKGKIQEIQKQIPNFKGKLTEAESLHLTLKFLGEITDDKIKLIRNLLDEIESRKFEAEISSIGFFDNKFQFIVWLFISNCEKIQNEIDEKLSQSFEKEKIFMSHLTIARIKSLDDKKLFINSLKKIKFDPIKFDVDSFCLMKSELSKEGPKYSIIEKYFLKD
jgi:2'-5' RNA ligase